MPQNKTLIIIPSFNEKQNIVQLIDRLFELYDDVDVLVVDDLSPDGTADVVKAAQARHGGKLKLLVRQGKGGRGSAVMEGCEIGMREGYETVMEMDADFSHKPEEVRLLREKLGHGCDCVIGSRYVPGSEIREWGIKRTVFSRLANRFARFVLGIPINDYTNGFRAYTRRAIEAVDFTQIDATGYVVLSEFAWQIHKAGLKFAEVPTLFVNRRRGASNLGFHEINEALFSVLRIRWPHLSALFTGVGTFALRGTVGAAIDLLSLYLLVRFAQLPTLTGFVLSGLIAMTAMLWLQHKRWGGHTTMPFAHSVMLYAAIAVSCIALAAAFSHWGMEYLTAKALSIVITAPLSYILRHSLFRAS